MNVAFDMTIEDLVSLPLQTFFLCSYDGQYVYFLSNKSSSNELYQFSLTNHKLKQLSHGEPPKTLRFPLNISKDDRYIFYLKDPIEGNEKYNIYSFDVKTCKEEQITNTTYSMDFFVDIFHDSSKIIFVSDRDNYISQIFLSDLEGSDVRQLTHHKQHVDLLDGNFILSHDDTSIIYTANESSTIKNGDIWKFSFISGSSEKIFSLGKNSKEIAHHWTQDDNSIVITTDYFGFQKVGILNLQSNKITWFGSKKYDEVFANLYEENNQLLVLRFDGANIKVIAYNIIDGTEQELLLPDGFYFHDTKIILGDSLLFRNTDSTHRLRAILYNLTTNTYEEIIPSEHGKYSADDFNSAQYIYYESEKGLKIYALLYVPQNQSSNDKFPALIIPHGGPTYHYTNTFIEEAQIYSNNGYVLLYPNIRGSTGYGIKFRDACIHDWGGKDLVDIEYGVKYLQHLPFVDNDRIGIKGGSYGGFMTYLAMTKIPQYFKAGSAVIGISSLRLNYEENKKTFPALSRYFEEQMGIPDNEKTIQLWEDRSAVNFLSQMTGKLQIIHTTNDPRCPLSQAEVVKEKLLSMGKKQNIDFDYQVFSNTGHGSSEIPFRLQYFHKQLEFFNKYLKE